MEVAVDQVKAVRELQSSLRRVIEEPAILCAIKPAIDFIMNGRGCLTYRYILFTALTAKAANENIDIMSLQVGDDSDGAYDARSLCKRVVFPFQREFLDDVLDGNNEDPLVNNPGRNLRIDVSNKAQSGDPRKALNLLCDYLPIVTTSDIARECLDYFIAQCLSLAEVKRNQAQAFSTAVMTSGVFETRRFMSELLDKSFGGQALLLVVNAIAKSVFPIDEGFDVVPHPVNQSGATGRQMSDLDVFRGGKPFLAVELKDKPFTENEVKKAAQVAYAHHAPAMLFVAGRASFLSEEAFRYFNEAKAVYGQRGMTIGVVTIDALMDLFFTMRHELDSAFVLDCIDKTMDEVHVSPEIMQWVFRQATSLGDCD